MDSIERIEARAAALSELVAQKFGPKGPDLARQTRALGRRVPKSVRADLELVASAAAQARHPRLARLTSQADLHAAERRATLHLQNIDPLERRKGALLAWAGNTAVRVLLVAGLFVAVLAWRGFV